MCGYTDIDGFSRILLGSTGRLATSWVGTKMPNSSGKHLFGHPGEVITVPCGRRKNGLLDRFQVSALLVSISLYIIVLTASEAYS
jgi:hypothetical protein